MVSKGHKITIVPLFKKVWHIIDILGDNLRGQDNLRSQKSLGPFKMSLEMANKVIVPQKINYVPHFLKQRDINSYYISMRALLTNCYFSLLEDFRPHLKILDTGVLTDFFKQCATPSLPLPPLSGYGSPSTIISVFDTTDN